MKKMKLSKKIGFLFILSLLFVGCKKNIGKYEDNVSINGGDESHNMGQNCLNCHKSGGEGAKEGGWFNIAGTVYKPDYIEVNPNVTVNLYSQPNGEGDIIYSIGADAKGNFYTTKTDIDFSQGLYPGIVNQKNGVYYRVFMSSSVKKGNCISCHGNTTNKLWVQ